MSVQSMQALERANCVRLTNAATRRRIARLERPEGCEEVARLLESDESYELARMKAEALISGINRIGVAGARVVLGKVGVSMLGKRIGELTPRQRVELARLVREASRAYRSWAWKAA